MKIKNNKNSPPTTPFCRRKKIKNSNSVVFEIANNFIAGIQFKACRTATKKLTRSTAKNRQTTPFTPKNLKKNLACFFLRMPKFYCQNTIYRTQTS